MAINQLVKQSAETFSIYGGVTNVAEDEETIVLGSSTVKCYDNTGTEDSTMLSGAPTVSDDGLRLYQRLAGSVGTEALSPYKITFKMVTTEGNLYEKDVFVTVKDR